MRSPFIYLFSARNTRAQVHRRLEQMSRLPTSPKSQQSLQPSHHSSQGVRTHVFRAGKPRARIALPSCMKTAPEAYHVCAEKGVSLCKAPSWVLLLQSTVSPPTLESSFSRLPCISLSLPVARLRRLRAVLGTAIPHLSALIPAFSFLVISVGWLLYRHGWPAVAHGRWRCKPTRNR